MKEQKNYKGKRNNKGYSKSQRSKTKEEVRDERRTKVDNDPTWYYYTEQQLKDAASLAFAENLGLPLPNIYKDADNNGTADVAIPGLMVVRYKGLLGHSVDRSSPINVAARNLYSYVRYANSGSANYDAPDLMLYVQGANEIYSYWATLCRLYGIMNTYNVYNRYYPRAVVEAMYVDFDDMQRHISDLRAFINTFAFKMGSICIPMDNALAARRIWMNSKIWVDDVSGKPQSYMFMPRAFASLNEMAEGGTILEYADFGGPGDLMTFEEIVAYGESMLAAMLESESFMIMSGDILKAFGKDRLFKLQEIAADFAVFPEYSEELVSQIQNCIAAPVDMEFDVRVDGSNNLIISRAYATGTIPSAYNEDHDRMLMAAAFDKRVFNIWKDSPDPKDVIVASRLLPFFNYSYSGSTYTFEATDVGTELVVGINSYAYSFANGVRTLVEYDVVQDYTYQYTGDTIAYSQFNKLMLALSNVTPFAYQPTIYVSRRADTNWTKAPRLTNVLCEYANYTGIERRVLSNMNRVALLREFGAPTMGAF